MPEEPVASAEIPKEVSLEPHATEKLIEMREAQEAAASPEFAERYKMATAMIERAESLGLNTLAQRMRARMDGVTEWPKEVPDSEGRAAQLLADCCDVSLVQLGDKSRFAEDTLDSGESPSENISLLEVSGWEEFIKESIVKLAEIVGVEEGVEFRFQPSDSLKQNDQVFRGLGTDIRDIEVAELPIQVEGSPHRSVFEVVRGIGHQGIPHYEVRVREKE